MVSRTAVYFALLSCLAIAPITHASEAGGVPALNTRVTVLEGAVTTLQSLLTVLQTKVTALETANTSLQTRVTSLEGANSSLTAALATERAARIAGDSATQAALGAEKLSRIQGDSDLAVALQLVQGSLLSLQGDVSGLQNQLNTLGASSIGDLYEAQGNLSDDFNNNAPTTIVSLNVPAGTYLIHAVVPTFNGDADSQTGQCAFSTAHAGDISGESAFFVEVPSSTNLQIPLIDARTFASAATISVQCTGFNWFAQGPTIKALRIRSIQSTPE